MQYVFPVSQLDSVSQPSSDEFQSGYIGARRPIKLAGEFTNWPPVRKWTPEFLRNTIGHLEVDVMTSSNERFEGDPESGFARPGLKQRVPVSKYLDWVYSSETLDYNMYLGQVGIFRQFPDLAIDVMPPSFIKLGREFKTDINLWVGKAGTVSPLHFDGSDNILIQVAGKKRLLLFSPKDTPNLYPHSPQSKLPHCSRVDVERPDVLQFPLMVNAHAWEVVLDAGDAVFMPVGWWHQVYTLETGISVNIWWSRRTPSKPRVTT